MTLKSGNGAVTTRSTILLSDIRNAIRGQNYDLKERQRIVGKIQNVSILMYEDRHRIGPLYDFANCNMTPLVE